MTEPYALPASLEPDLQRALDYWQGLIKGANNMPFWDDFRSSALPDLSPRMALLDVFDEPLRLRFGDFVGLEVIQRYGAPLHGQFLDELELTDPFEHLAPQASAAVEDRKPNYHRHASRGGYSRLLMPMWGRGRVWALMCAYVWR